MWSATLHPCLMLKLSGGHIYHSRTTVPYLFQVTQERYSSSTGDDGHENTDSSLSVLIPLVWRSHFLSGEPTDVKQSHLSHRLSRSAAISHSGGIDFAGIGPSVINVKKIETFFTSRCKRGADISHVGLWECFYIPAAAFLNAWGEETRCWVSELHNKSSLSWSKIETV